MYLQRSGILTILTPFRQDCINFLNATQLIKAWAHGLARQYDRDVNPKNKGSEKVRAGIGMYYFEETPKVEK